MDSVLKLSDVLNTVKDVVSESFSGSVWIEADLADWKIIKFSGHAYGEMVEYNKSNKKIASCRFTCWKFKVFEIDSYFKEITGEKIKPGIKVKLEIKLTFSELYGFSANIIDIDPKFTLGDLQVNLQDIINKLVVKKIERNNIDLVPSFDFFNISVISSPTAAGLDDFKEIANELMSDKLCNFNYFDALMQGEKCASSVVNAISQAKELNKTTSQDCLIILRGGGSVLDLASFNDYDLAKEVCSLKIPVFCAIGHEKDKCILDFVSHHSFGTPSKVANYIEQTIHSNASGIIKNYALIEEKSNYIVNNAESELSNLLIDIQLEAKRRLEVSINSVKNLQKSIINTSNNYVNQAQDKLCSNFKLILANSLEPTLKKGYVVAFDCQHNVVVSKDQAKNCKISSLKFYDGEYYCDKNNL
jgi:exodeoxyribonuclease VII large subunit